MQGTNHQVTMASRPVGMPKESDFHIVESAIPHPAAGEVLVQAIYLSLDPYMRLRMDGSIGYSKPVRLGEVLPGGVVGRVVESNDPRLGDGELVQGMLGWQEFAAAPAKALRKVDPNAGPISTALYVLGIPGLTAYFGLLDICRPQPGDTVVVSAAAGAVGSLVGQIAKIKRCRAVGIAGSDDKIQFITRELGYDAGFNYKSTDDYYGKLKELCPNGIDVYFDNVGGAITDAVIRLINTRARIAVCGQMSQINSEEPQMGPRWLGQLILKQAKVEGFLFHQFTDRFDEAYKQLSSWLRERRIRYREDIVKGLPNAPRSFIGLLQGRNIGKQLVKLAE